MSIRGVEEALDRDRCQRTGPRMTAVLEDVCLFVDQCVPSESMTGNLRFGGPDGNGRVFFKSAKDFSQTYRFGAPVAILARSPCASDSVRHVRVEDQTGETSTCGRHLPVEQELALAVHMRDHILMHGSHNSNTAVGIVP